MNREIIDSIQEYFTFPITELKKLNGYANANYLLKTAESKYIFKTYVHSEETVDQINAEIDALLFLQKEKRDEYPLPVAFADGSYLKIIPLNKKPVICRLLTFLEGDFLAEVTHTPELFHSWGRLLAKSDLTFESYKNYKIQSRTILWDLQHLPQSKDYIEYISTPEKQRLVRYFIQQYEENVIPVLTPLKKSIIHNDPNEWNILVKNGQVSGMIDFGDIAYTYRINNLAIAIAYGIYDKENPLDWASYLIESYHAVIALEEVELNILYYLIAARLCISVSQSAYESKLNPTNEYISVSEENAWNLLRYWITVSPTHASNHFLKAAGFQRLNSTKIDDVISRRHRIMDPIVSLSYSVPIHMERAAFQYMYDTQGNTFLDAYNNIPHVGHSHPAVVEAGQRQMAKLNTNTRYLYDQLAEYGEKLLATFPASLNKVFFVNSGSAASDLAIRLARAHTGQSNMMVMEHGYHGNTQLSIDISDYKFSNKKGQGQKDNIIKTPIPNTYHGNYTNNDGTAGRQYAQDAIYQIEKCNAGIAAFITEPIVGCGGQVPLASGYLKNVYPAVRKQGGICISDEVQTGFGRLGDHFWGFEGQEVIPDIVVLGKPMANGHPMGAVITTSEIAESFSHGVEFFSSFGGNPISCAIASSVLDVIKEEQLQENAKAVGDYYQHLFRELQKSSSCIGDVRGSGLFIGVEIVHEGGKDPNTKLAQHIKNELRNQYILMSTDGPYDNVLKTKPPLCFTKENAEQVVESVRRILTTFSMA